MANEITVTVGPIVPLTVQTGVPAEISIEAVVITGPEGPEGPSGPEGPIGPTGLRGPNGALIEPDVPDLSLLFENGLR